MAHEVHSWCEHSRSLFARGCSSCPSSDVHRSALPCESKASLCSCVSGSLAECQSSLPFRRITRRSRRGSQRRRLKSCKNARWCSLTSDLVQNADNWIAACKLPYAQIAASTLLLLCAHCHTANVSTMNPVLKRIFLKHMKAFSLCTEKKL